MGAGLFGNIFPADIVDHEAPFPPMPEIGANVATGEYLTRLCSGCHGADLGGGPATGPDAPPSPGLGGVRAWSATDWETFAQTGRTPDGRDVNPQFMPWTAIGKLSPEERLAIYLYLHSRS